MNISINVFGYENDKVVTPLFLTPMEKENHANLILLRNNIKSHYICAKKKYFKVSIDYIFV